jgi:manganese oxidase
MSPFKSAVRRLMPSPLRSVPAGVLLLIGLATTAAVVTGNPLRQFNRGNGTAVDESATSLPLILWNDNEKSGGRLEGKRFAIDLEVVRAEWRYLGPESQGTEVLAFGEAGRAPLNPGPLIRVPLGAQLSITIRNPLDRPLVVHGLGERWVAAMDSVVVPAGETRRVSFTADVAGTFYYWGSTTGTTLSGRMFEDSQLTGAFIVDAPGEQPVRERIMVMSIHFAGVDSEGEPDDATETFAINGRPWPHTERLTYDVGDTVHWRVINTAQRVHPMHLHGFYFELDAKGDMLRPGVVHPSQRRLLVTEAMEAGETMRMRWVAERPGGWVFHCHLSWHVLPNAAPGQYASTTERTNAILFPHLHGDAHNHVVEGMGGLMIGVEIRERVARTVAVPRVRRLRLIVRSDSTAGIMRRFAFTSPGADGAIATDPLRWPGPVLVMRRGEPTSVMVINMAHEPTQVHWHGLEVDSYFDGVVGVGGYSGMRTPAIMPADSFELRVTPPRAGSFMYHTHLHDIRQQSAGLYGGIVVLEPGEEWDTARDHVLLLSSNGVDNPPILNGAGDLDTLTWRVGEKHRLRLMNVTLASASARFRMVGPNGYAARWTSLAEDGADLPQHLRVVGRADVNVTIGKTMDFEFIPQRPGEYRLEVRSGGGTIFGLQVIRVEPAPEES